MKWRTGTDPLIIRGAECRDIRIIDVGLGVRIVAYFDLQGEIPQDPNELLAILRGGGWDLGDGWLAHVSVASRAGVSKFDDALEFRISQIPPHGTIVFVIARTREIMFDDKLWAAVARLGKRVMRQPIGIVINPWSPEELAAWDRTHPEDETAGVILRQADSTQPFFGKFTGEEVRA